MRAYLRRKKKGGVMKPVYLVQIAWIESMFEWEDESFKYETQGYVETEDEAKDACLGSEILTKDEYPFLPHDIPRWRYVEVWPFPSRLAYKPKEQGEGATHGH